MCFVECQLAKLFSRKLKIEFWMMICKMEDELFSNFFRSWNLRLSDLPINEINMFLGKRFTKVGSLDPYLDFYISSCAKLRINKIYSGIFKLDVDRYPIENLTRICDDQKLYDRIVDNEHSNFRLMMRILHIGNEDVIAKIHFLEPMFIDCVLEEIFTNAVVNGDYRMLNIMMRIFGVEKRTMLRMFSNLQIGDFPKSDNFWMTQKMVCGMIKYIKDENN